MRNAFSRPPRNMAEPGSPKGAANGSRDETQLFDFLLAALGAMSGTCLIGYAGNSFMSAMSQGTIQFDMRGLAERARRRGAPTPAIVAIEPCETSRQGRRTIVRAAGQRFWITDVVDPVCEAVRFTLDDRTLDFLVCGFSEPGHLLAAEIDLERLAPLWQKTRDAAITAAGEPVAYGLEVLYAIVEAIPAPTLLTQADGTLVVANDRALRELAGGAMITIADRSVTTSHPAEAEALSAAVRGSLADGDGDMHTVVVTDTGSAERRIAVVRRFDLMAGMGEAAEPLCMVTILPRVALAAASRIAAAYGLTASERRLVARLVTGTNVREAATALGIRENSARTYLKRIFSKMGINRQAQLVSILSSQGAMLHGDAADGAWRSEADDGAGRARGEWKRLK